MGLIVSSYLMLKSALSGFHPIKYLCRGFEARALRLVKDMSLGRRLGAFYLQVVSSLVARAPEEARGRALSGPGLKRD
jgi:hypothetical protein